jgi:hypothetical protein
MKNGLQKSFFILKTPTRAAAGSTRYVILEGKICKKK